MLTLEFLINDFKKLISQYTNNTLEHFSDLKKIVIQLEMSQEYEFLSSITHFNENELKHAFLKRCAARAEINQKSFLSWNQFPEGKTNILYFKIALQLFEPKNLAELLKILIPSITSVVELVDPVIPAFYNNRERSSYMKKNPFVLKIGPIEQLSHYPVPRDLSKIIFSKTTCIDLSVLENMHLDHHVNFHRQIQQLDLELFELIYQQNYHLAELKKDIENYINKGQSPKDAILDLIKGLNSGGYTITKDEEQAGITAQTAYALFKDYFKSLPSSVINELLSLKSSEKITLATILSRLELVKLPTGCIESAALSFESLLKANPLIKSLINSPLFTEEQIKALKKKYSNKQEYFYLNEESTSFIIPKNYIRPALACIDFTMIDELIILLWNVPPEIYPELLDYQSLRGFYSTWISIAKAVGLSLFNNKQVEFIIKGFIKNSRQFNDRSSMMLTAIYSNNDNWVSKAIEIYFTKAKKSEPKVGDYAELLYWSIHYPKSFNTIIEYIPEQDLLNVLRYPISSGDCVLNFIAKNKTLLRYALIYLPESDRYNFLNYKVKDQRIIDYFIEFNLIPPTNIVFKNSFAPYFINTYKIIHNQFQKSSLTQSIVQLDLINASYQLWYSWFKNIPVYDYSSYEVLTILCESKSFDEVKIKLFSWIQEHSQSSIAIQLNGLFEQFKSSQENSEKSSLIVS